MVHLYSTPAKLSHPIQICYILMALIQSLHYLFVNIWLGFSFCLIKYMHYSTTESENQIITRNHEDALRILQTLARGNLTNSSTQESVPFTWKVILCNK